MQNLHGRCVDDSCSRFLDEIGIKLKSSPAHSHSIPNIILYIQFAFLTNKRQQTARTCVDEAWTIRGISNPAEFNLVLKLKCIFCITILINYHTCARYYNTVFLIVRWVQDF